MDCKNIRIISKILLILMCSVFLQSCATDLHQTEIKEVDGYGEIKVISESFIKKSYGQNIKKLDNNGIDTNDIKLLVTDGYLNRISGIAYQYRVKRRSFSEADQNLLSRFFTSETNVMVLRPWSYQPDQESITVIGDSRENLGSILVKYHENRWNDRFDVTARFFYKYENGSWRIDDILWEDDTRKRRISERLSLLEQALKTSANFDEFEKSARIVY